MKPTTIRRRMTVVLALLGLVAALGVTTGCQEKGPAEKAGAAIDKALGEAKETAKETAEEATKAVEKAAEDAKEAAEKAAREVKKAADEATKKD